MSLRQRIISEIYDEKDNNVVDRKIIEDKKIDSPVKIDLSTLFRTVLSRRIFASPRISLAIHSH